MSEIYPPPTPPGHHPERTLPIGGSRPLTSGEHALVLERMEAARSLPPKPPGKFQFHAAFDGTWNERVDPALLDNTGETGVSIIERLMKAEPRDNFVSHYEKGVGTNGFMSKYIAASIFPSGEVYSQAAKAYDALVDEANKWNSESTDGFDIGITAMGFSRGGAAAIVFANILNEQGIPDTRSSYTVEVPGRADMGHGIHVRA